jgi:hypothetical protein
LAKAEAKATDRKREQKPNKVRVNDLALANAGFSGCITLTRRQDIKIQPNFFTLDPNDGPQKGPTVSRQYPMRCFNI